MQRYYYKQNRLKQLRAFCNTARSESMSKAAEQMFLSQPSISLLIKALEKDLEKSQYAWDSQTFPDGRYEFKVIASDKNSNPPGHALTDSRVSRPVVADNSPPVVEEIGFQVNGNQVNVNAILNDVYSIVSAAVYTVDSHKDWLEVLPVDEVFDSRREIFKFQVDIEKSGEHYLALRFWDAQGNRVSRFLNVIIP